MLLGVIADDFTGASDIANNITKGVTGEGGLNTVQYVGVPSKDAGEDVDAGVISLKTRSIPVEDAVAQSLAALDWLLRQGCKQIFFKYCSTFDSTKEGNIGPVSEALASRMGANNVVVCPAFPSTGRSVYQGHLFVHDVLLNQSGLEHHPLNPMTDADIRRWLEYQSTGPVGHVARPIVSQGPEAIKNALNQINQTLIVVDAIDDQDLLAIGEAVAEAPLVTGGSGLAIGLPRNFIRQGLAHPPKAMSGLVKGPAAILAGSCSGATREQVAYHQQNNPTFALDVEQLVAGQVTPEQLVGFVFDNQSSEPLVYSSSPPEDVERLQARFGREALAAQIEGLFSETAKLLVANGVKRLVVAGGETSGAVVSALSLGEMRIGVEIDPGVPVLYTDESDPLGLALKSGNFGATDFFSKALKLIGQP